MGRVKTFTNGGSLLPGDLNSIQDDYELGFASYRHLVKAAGGSVASTAATYMLGTGIANFLSTAGSPKYVEGFAFYLDPADYAAGSRTVKYRVRAQLVSGSPSAAITFTAGLYPVATYDGSGVNQPTIASLGSVVGGSTVAFASPGTNTQLQNNSGDFTAPAAGFFVLACVLSGTSGEHSLMADLQVRQT